MYGRSRERGERRSGKPQTRSTAKAGLATVSTPTVLHGGTGHTHRARPGPRIEGGPRSIGGSTRKHSQVAVQDFAASETGIMRRETLERPSPVCGLYSGTCGRAIPPRETACVGSRRGKPLVSGLGRAGPAGGSSEKGEGSVGVGEEGTGGVGGVQETLRRAGRVSKGMRISPYFSRFLPWTVGSSCPQCPDQAHLGRHLPHSRARGTWCPWTLFSFPLELRGDDALGGCPRSPLQAARHRTRSARLRDMNASVSADWADDTPGVAARIL